MEWTFETAAERPAWRIICMNRKECYSQGHIVEILLSMSATLSSRDAALRGKPFNQGGTLRVPLNFISYDCYVITSFSFFQECRTLIRGVTTLAEVIDTDDQEEVGLCYAWGSAKSMFGTQVVYCSVPWFFPWPILIVNKQAKLLHPEKGMVTRCSDLPWMRVWVTLPDLQRHEPKVMEI